MNSGKKRGRGQQALGSLGIHTSETTPPKGLQKDPQKTVPNSQSETQNSNMLSRPVHTCRLCTGGIGVVVVGVVVVVVVCAWQLPLAQFPLQHCSFLVQVLPLRLQPGGSAPASPMPSDPSVPPTTAAPINLRALPRVTLPSAVPRECP